MVRRVGPPPEPRFGPVRGGAFGDAAPGEVASPILRQSAFQNAFCSRQSPIRAIGSCHSPTTARQRNAIMALGAAPPQTDSTVIPIAIVERDTGIAKDTLRIWERRYGFPKPQRDASGERNYSVEEVEKLRALKRLMDRGMRPGKLIALPLGELHEMAQAVPERSRTRDEQAMVDRVVDLVRRQQAGELRVYLQKLLIQQGLRTFCAQTLARLNPDIGDAWARGSISVAHEHIYTQAVQNVLHGLIAAQPAAQGRPRILLTTVPGELHTLGLLMAEVLWSAEGAECISLGPQFPVADIPDVVADGAIDVVTLSFSLACNAAQALASLRTLRSSLPARVEIWAGGGALGGRRKVDGVRIIGPIEGAVDALADWVSAHAN
ncbi:MAG: MerR family transcriptional regulator [Rhodocyclaceae bacterium]|nr:MerR family transcriptional regulator [Rhodocyclaceae bacterium]